MNKLLRVGIQIGLVAAASTTWAQHLRVSTAPYADDAPKPPKEIEVLFDTAEHRTALTLEIKSERGADGNLNVLKACIDAGIICGFELNSEMLKIFRGFTQKRYTLYSLFRGTFGKSARVTWKLQDYVAHPTPTGYAPFYVLTITPRQGPTNLDQLVVWNVAMSGGAQWDTHDLGVMIDIHVDPPSPWRRYVGISADKPIRMPARDALNHIAAKTETSWQVVYSSGNKKGNLSIYSGAQPSIAHKGRLDKERQTRLEQRHSREPLFDSEENRLALNREFADERTPEGHLDVLKACASAEIVCGFELSSEMLRILDAPSQKRRTLYSLLRDNLGEEAQVSWIAPEYIAGRLPRVLLIEPKHPRAILDRTVVWNLATSGGAKLDAYELSRMTGLDADPASEPGGLTGPYNYSQRVRMPIRTVLNHIAATNNASWQVIYSSGNTAGKISVYPNK